MYKCTYSETITRTAVSILAALSLSICTAASGISKTSTYRTHRTSHADKELVAAFPFRKHKNESKSNETKTAQPNSESNAGTTSSQNSNSTTETDSKINSAANQPAEANGEKPESKPGEVVPSKAEPASSGEKTSAESDQSKNTDKSNSKDQEDKKSTEKTKKKKKDKDKDKEDGKDIEKNKDKNRKDDVKDQEKPTEEVPEQKKKKEKNKDKNDKQSNKNQKQDKNIGEKNESGSNDAASVQARSKDDEKAANKAKEAKEAADRELAKAANKAEKKKQKEAKAQSEARAQSEAKAQSEATAQGEAKAKGDKKDSTEKKSNDEKKQPPAKSKASEIETVPARTTQGDYKPDSALISLLKDLARALNDPTEQAKLEDENQKFVLKLAVDVLNKAIDSRTDANRIVDKNSISRSSMSAEAWSSGDVKVSNECRGSLAAVWAKKENGLLNVTIAGFCKDKVAPCGKNAGEYVVVVSAHSSIQKGFDIQSQSDVDFWLAKLVSVNVDSSCCNTPPDQNKSSDAGDTRELSKHSTVVLQAIMTERERLFNNPTASALTPVTSQTNLAEARKDKNQTAIADASAAEKQEERKNKEVSDAAQPEPDQVQKAKTDKKAEREKQRLQDERQKQLEAETKQKQKEEERRLEAESKRRYEEEERRAEAETKRKMEEEARLAESEERQKKEEKIRLAQAEKMRKANEKLQKANGKQQKSDEKLLKADDKDNRNAPMSRNDAILAEAARQVELEQQQGILNLDPSGQVSSEQMSRADAILAEAARQAEAERREAADMRMPYGNSSPENNAIAPSVEIDNEPTALRPTPRISDLIGYPDLSDKLALSIATPTAPGVPSTSATIADLDETQKKNPSPHNAMDYPTPPLETQKLSTTNLIAEREAAKGWDSPGLPADVKEPGNGSRMVLPQKAIAGQHITASVLDANHTGESGIELGFNGVRLSTDASGKVTFMVPEDAVPGNSLSVAMVGNSQTRPVQVEVLQPLSTSSQQEPPSIERASNMVSSNGTVVLDGHNFDGIADHNQVMIDETTECKVTAASPVQLKATVPTTVAPGIHFATVHLRGTKSNPGRFDLVTAEVRPDKKEADKEQETTLTVKVLGTTNQVQVRLTNQTPDVIKISKGNDLHLTTSGGDDNSANVEVQRLRKGSYRVDAVIEQ